MSSRGRLVRATGGMAAVTAVSRVSGYLRDKTIAALLGAGNVADAFLAGLAVPNMFRAFLAEGSLHAAFIPALAEVKARGSAEQQRDFVRSMTTTLLLVLPVVVAMGVLAAEPLVRLLAPGLRGRGEAFTLAVRLTRLMFPYLGVVSLAALAQGVLNASGKFLLPAATPIALNLCTVAGTVIAVEVAGGGWGWLAAGVVAGGLAQLGIQWRACARAGLPLVPGGLGLRHPEVRRVLALMLPGIPALGVYELTLLLSVRLASQVGPGALTARFNAARLNELVYGVLIVQLTTAVLPMLAAERARDPAAARAMLGFSLRLLSVAALPAAVFAALLAGPIAGTAYGGGQYGAAAVATTAGALAMYSLGLPFLGLTKMLASTAYAWRDTRAPVLAATANLIVFWLIAVQLTPRYGVAGLAAAASIGQVTNSLMLLALNGRAGRLPQAREVIPGIARHLLASALLAAALAAGRPLLPPMLVTSARNAAILLAVAGVSAALYAGALVALRAPEWRELRSFLRQRRQA